MTSVIFDIRNFASEGKFKAQFHTNQSVSTTYNGNNGIVTVTSLQDGSTPGVLVNNLWELDAKSTYEFIVLGNSGANVTLWAKDKTNNILLNDGTKRVTIDSNANHMFVTNRKSTKIKAQFGILFEKPAELGDQFTLEAVALIKREGTVDGLWRQFEHENLVIKDKYSITEREWKATVTYTNTD